MNEDKEPKNGQGQEPKNVFSKAGKLVGEQGKKKIFKKLIIALAPILLKFIVVALCIYIVISSILNFIDGSDSKESKEATSSAISYGSSTKTNKITVDINNIASNGAYILKYKFKDEEGNALTEENAIKQIKRDLLKENEKIDLSKFSDSELKIIGSLMYNGLETGKYNEEQLKAFAIFVKSDVAGRSFDLRADDVDVSVEDLSKTDEVYGTLELHKTTPKTDEQGNLTYEEIKLQYVPYSTFRDLIEKNDESVLKMFSIKSKGDLVIAKLSSSSIKITYKNENGTEIPETDIGKIDIEDGLENEETYNIKEHAITIDYKPYIKKYIAPYGFLSDLLIATNNVNFCLEIAQLALNSKIVLNLREEQIDTYTYEETEYNQTSLLYDYVKYEMNEYDVTETWDSIESGNGSPESSGVPASYGWNSNLNRTETGENGRTYTYVWKKSGETYKLNHIDLSTYQRWALYKMREEKVPGKTKTFPQTLIVGGHITESYDGYTIDEDYTAKEEFKYTRIIESTSTDYKYDIDISEIDCWYLTYKRPYVAPNKEVTAFPPPQDVAGAYPENATVIQEPTSDASIIDSDEHVQAFIIAKEKEYLTNNQNVNDVECKVTELTISRKSKASSKLEKYVGTRTKYTFGDEENLDTTQVQFKNLEYINSKPSFTADGPQGFLYIYDKYISEGIDLCLQNDAEKKFFELLEADKETSEISNVMKFLLYVYDGIDRGVTDLDKRFAVIDLSLRGGSNYGASAFGCNLTKEEFILATEAYQGDSILATLAEDFYDICTSPEYNVNPCLAYAWAATESGWGKSAVNDKNLFQIGTYTDQTSGKKFASYEDAIRAFCQWVVDAADPSTDLFSFNYKRAQEYATENKRFEGTPQNNIYAQFCTFGFVGYVHTGNARACIEKSAQYLYGVNECNHSDEEATTAKERADWAKYIVDTKMDLARAIFGKDCIGGHGSIVEAAYEVADHFLNSGVDVHYAAAHKNGNSIILPDQHDIQACYDLPIQQPKRYGIVCTTFVNLAIWKAGLIDTDTMNTFAIHSPILSAMAMEKLEGWEVITDASELQEGDIVYTAQPAHTWIYMDGNKMLDQTYCVINADGYDSRGALKDASWGIAGFTKGFRYVGK